MSKIVKMINALNPKGAIPTPTYEQAFVHLLQAVRLADKQGVHSVTIEAIRTVTQALQGPPPPSSTISDGVKPS